MGSSQEESWHASTDPLLLLRLSRVRPSGRKYLLLACAAVRHLMPGARTELGARALTELECFAVAAPATGAATDLWREVVRPHVLGAPDAPDPLPFDRNFGADGAWMRQFVRRLHALSQVHIAEVNEVFDLAFARVRAAATQEARYEARTLAAQLLLGSPVAPAGWFARLLRQVTPLTPKARFDSARFRDEIIARLPAAKRDRVAIEWPAGAAGFSPWQRGLTYLTAAREEQRLAEAAERACELVREVFGDPFRPPALAPSWLGWNHGAARHIAERIVATGDFGDLPVLADALEDAGCADAELLAHCREGQSHVPGCWVLDAALGR